MSNADELVKLKELLDSGALTPEEFESEKKRLLHTDQEEPPKEEPKASPPPPPPAPVKMPPKPSKWPLILMACVVVIILIGILSPSTPKEEKAIPSADWIAFDDKAWSSFKTLYRDHLVYLKYVDLYNAGRYDPLSFYEKSREAEDVFFKRSNGYSYGTNPEQKDYLNQFVDMATADNLAAKYYANYLENFQINTLTRAKQNLDIANGLSDSIIAGRGYFWTKAGLSSDEIQVKSDQMYAELQAIGADVMAGR